MMDWYLLALAFGLGLGTGLLAGVGIRVTIDYAELAMYRIIARRAEPRDQQGDD